MLTAKVTNAFKKNIELLGTSLIVEYLQGENVIRHSIKSSLVAATEAAYNVTDREFLFKGDVIIPDDFIIPSKYAGCYFIRDGVADRKYMFLSMLVHPETPGVGAMYAVQCNEKVNLFKSVQVTDEYLNVKEDYQKTYENIDCYFTAVVRSPKIQNDGLLDQTIYNLQIPARYMIAPMQMISRMEPKIVKKQDEDGNDYYDTEMAEVRYQIDSVDKSLMVVNENDGEISGVLIAQLSRNLRADA